MSHSEKTHILKPGLPPITKKKEFVTPKLSEVEALTSKLIDANQRLTDYERSRSELLAHIFHDVRSPVTAIRSTIDYLSICNADTPWAEVQEMIKVLDMKTSSLEALIRNFYYLFSLEAGEQSFHYSDVSLNELLEEFFFTIRFDKKYAGKNLILKVPETPPCPVHIDLQQIVRVLDNLFSNAAKYSGEGATIVLGLTSPTKEENFVCFWVQDTGIGIPEKYQKRIFKRTFKLDESRTPNEGGSGIGLSIVKSILEQHGGDVWCESTVGEGSCFYVKLPLIK